MNYDCAARRAVVVASLVMLRFVLCIGKGPSRNTLATATPANSFDWIQQLSETAVLDRETATVVLWRIAFVFEYENIYLAGMYVRYSASLLHAVAQSNAHNENSLKTKITPPMAPKDNGVQIDSALCNAGHPH